MEANLPPRLVSFLEEHGHEASHVADTDTGVTSSDVDIARWADKHGAVVVSKDSDFRSMQLASGRPAKLLGVATGNISTKDLLRLLGPRLDAIGQSERCTASANRAAHRWNETPVRL